MHYFLAQLWKYDNSTKILENKNGNWMYETKKWELSAQEESGKVTLSLSQNNSTDMKNNSAIFLGLPGNSNKTGSKVVLEPFVTNSVWYICCVSSDGFFSL